MAVIYFDNNATSRMSQVVKNAMMEVCNMPSNASSIHSLGRQARNIIENARSNIIQTLKAPKHFRIIFTSSATEANNLILNSFKNERIFCSQVEHPSIAKGPITNHISVNQNGEVNLQEINSNGVYSIILANNETGVVQQINNIAMHNLNGIVHVDAVQAIGKIPFSCSSIGAHAYTISGHKFGGPYGIGCLIYDPDKINIKPLIIGGGQEYGLRSGTENIMAIHGLSVAMQEIQERVIIMQEKILPIKTYIENTICSQYSNVRVFGQNAAYRLPNTISLTMPGVKSEIQVAYFDSHGIAVSAGAACSAGRVGHPHVLMAMNSSYEEASCALRVSLGIDNTMEEAQFFVQKWQDLYEKHKRG